MAKIMTMVVMIKCLNLKRRKRKTKGSRHGDDQMLELEKKKEKNKRLKA